MTQRFARRKRKGVRLTKRDLAIVRAIFEARYLTNRQVCRLLFTPGTFSWCKQRLRYLYDLGYLGKRAAYANEPDIYYLGLEGRRYIAGVCPEYTQEEIDRIAGVSGSAARAPILMMSHELTLSSLCVTARLDAYVQGLSLEWRNSRMLELMRLPMQPDAFIHVRGGRREHAAFLEYTGVLPAKAEMKRKLAAYEQYLESRRCKEDLRVEQVAVLWLSNTPAKRERILEAIAGSPYRDWFLVGLIEDADAFITGPVWRWGEEGTPVRWVQPQEEGVPA